MGTFTNDLSQASQRSGLLLALTAATMFGLSGTLARPLLDAGWSTGAVVLIRIAIGTLFLLPIALCHMVGHWEQLHSQLSRILAYGAFGVAGSQFSYFAAIAHGAPVAVALVIEFAAPLVVVAWMWVVHRHRPGRVVAAGMALCAVGLVLAVGLTSPTPVGLSGALWALGATLGLAAYFILSAHHDERSLPPTALAAGGLLVATTLLGLLAVLRLMPFHTGGHDLQFNGFQLPAWAALVLLGLITSSVPYVLGIAAARRLGARLVSLVALTEVLAATIWAAALIGQVPAPIQLLGGALVIAGVAVAKYGERQKAWSANDGFSRALRPTPVARRHAEALRRS